MRLSFGTAIHPEPAASRRSIAKIAERAVGCLPPVPAFAFSAGGLTFSACLQAGWVDACARLPGNSQAHFRDGTGREPTMKHMGVRDSGAQSGGAMLSGAAQGEARLLVVEDDPNIVELLSASLRFAGFDGPTATNGAEAVQLARESGPTSWCST